MVTEYGCSAYNKYWDAPRSEEGQACYHRGNWMDIEDNRAGGSGTGNALGGVIFEWTDEWWKAGPPPRFNAGRQETVPQFGAPFLDGWSYEEWLGLAGQGDGSQSPFLRQLRPAYFVYKELWNKRQ
jgi:beta-glucuronidase